MSPGLTTSGEAEAFGSYGELHDAVRKQLQYFVALGLENGSFGFSYARFLSSNIGLELDFKYNIGSKVALIDPSDQERFGLDTCNNYSVTGNILYKFYSGTVQPYVAGGVGMNVLSPFEKEFTSDAGSVIIITAPEKTNNLTFNVGAGLIIGNPVGLRIDVRFVSINNIDVNSIQLFAGAAFRF